MSSENFTITNTSLFEDNPFSDPIDEESYEASENLYHHWVYFYAAFELLKFIIGLAAFVSDIYLIVIMVKFKKLQNRVNNLILIFVILNVAYLALASLIMIIVELSIHSTMHQYCIINNLDHLTMTLSFYTLTFLAVDWYILNYHPDVYMRFPRTFKYGIGIASIILAICKWITTSVMCFENRLKVYAFRFSFEGITFVCCGLILICVGVLKHFRKPVQDTHKTEYAFSIPTVAFALSFPAYLTKLINLLAEDSQISKPTLKYLFLLEYIAECLFLVQPIVILFLLGRWNKFFKTAHLKCCKKNVREYDDDDLDSGSINETPENNVTFHKDSEVIRF